MLFSRVPKLSHSQHYHHFIALELSKNRRSFVKLANKRSTSTETKSRKVDTENGVSGSRMGRRRWSVGVWYFQAQLAGPRTGIQKFSQYYPSSMLPPPPPAPMARPVAIIRSTGELTAASSNSPPTSSTSPTDPSELASNQEQMAAAAAVGLVNSGCQSSVDPAGRKSPARILVTAPHTSREYTFAHFHSQPGQVSARGIPEHALKF